MDQMEQDWEAFKKKFNAKAGIDLNYYKRAQMQRRITNLMNRHGQSSYTAFFSQLEKDPKAYKEFVEYITINVTEFFRTPEKFEELEKSARRSAAAQSETQYLERWLFYGGGTLFAIHDLSRFNA